MAAFDARCPLCGSGFQAEEEWIGQTAECPSCSKEITIQAPQANPEPQKKKLTIKKPAADTENFASHESIPQANPVYSAGTVNAIQQSSGFAVASLTLGIVSLACGGPLLGIPAIVFGFIAMGKIKQGIGSGRGMAITGIITGSVGTFVVGIAILAGMLLPALSSAREKARQISCISNMKQIGLAIRMYSQDNKGQFPDKSGAEGLEMLRSGGYLKNSRIFTCPSTDTIPAGDGAKLTEDNIDYIYDGGYNESTNPETPVLGEKEGNHRKYENILFCNGYVQGFKKQ